MEIFDVLRPEVGTLEVESSRFEDSSFRLADVHALEANSDISQLFGRAGIGTDETTKFGSGRHSSG